MGKKDLKYSRVTNPTIGEHYYLRDKSRFDSYKNTGHWHPYRCFAVDGDTIYLDRNLNNQRHQIRTHRYNLKFIVYGGD